MRLLTIFLVAIFLPLSVSAQTSPPIQTLIAITPCRIGDTRIPGQSSGGMLAAGETRTFSIAGACGVPANATAYALNVTIVPPAAIGFVTVWPAGQPKPLASTVNSLAGQIVANFAIIQAGSNGAISVFASNQTHLVLDVNGYFAPAAQQTQLKLQEQCWDGTDVPSGVSQNFTLSKTPTGLTQLIINGLNERIDFYTVAGNVITWTHGTSVGDDVCAVFQ